MIVMDFSKAFDKVSHNKLISSLHEYGIDSTTLEWIRSFLSGRTQSVVVDGAESDSLPVKGLSHQSCVLTESARRPEKIQNAMVRAVRSPRARKQLRGISVGRREDS